MTSQIVIVHRYDEPSKFGVHVITDPERPSYTVGLFSEHEMLALRNTIRALGYTQASITPEEASPMAPIEWKSQLAEDSVLNRFEKYTI